MGGSGFCRGGLFDGGFLEGCRSEKECKSEMNIRSERKIDFNKLILVRLSKHSE